MLKPAKATTVQSAAQWMFRPHARCNTAPSHKLLNAWHLGKNTPKPTEHLQARKGSALGVLLMSVAWPMDRIACNSTTCISGYLLYPFSMSASKGKVTALQVHLSEMILHKLDNAR